MTTSTKIEIRHIIYGIAVLTAIGLVLYSLHKGGHIHIPSAVEIGQSGPKLAFLVALYFVIGFLILYLFFRPSTPAGVAGVAGASVLWGIY